MDSKVSCPDEDYPFPLQFRSSHVTVLSFEEWTRSLYNLLKVTLSSVHVILSKLDL
jgi:hypothetical protein